MRIVVLTKPVPDPAAGAERLGPDHRLDRAASPTVINGNDEYALEAALQLVEAHGGEVVVVTMAPANGTETIRKALAMGAQRGILITDEALVGADLPTTIRVLAAAVAPEPFDLLLGGLDTSDGAGGVVTAGVAARLGLPLLSAAGAIVPDVAAGRVRVHRLSARGYDLVEAPMPAVISCTQALGAPRYPSLKGIMAARSREIAIRSLADLGTDLAPASGGWASSVLAVDLPPARAAGRRSGPSPRHGQRDRGLPRRAEDHLMPATILAVAEVADGALTKLSTEVATLARVLAEAAGVTAVGLVVDPAPGAAATELAAFVPRVIAVTNPTLDGEVAAPHVAGEIVRLLGEGVTHVVSAPRRTAGTSRASSWA